jgi:hypothetical protein
MSDDSKTTGLAPYSGRKPGKPGPRDVLALLQESAACEPCLGDTSS